MLNNVLNIVENEQSSEFYPTPASLVEKMISGIHWESVKTILEPSAGKGDILREVAKNEEYKQLAYILFANSICPLVKLSTLSKTM